MDGVRRVARTARARLVRQKLVDTGGRWLVAGASVGLGLVVLGKCMSMPWMGRGALNWGAWLVGPVLLGGVVAVVRATQRRPSALAATRTIDQALGLKDRLSASLTLQATPGEGRDDPFERVLHIDAEAAARATDVARAVPLRWTRLWAAWPAPLVVGGVVGVFVPPLTPEARRLEERRVEREIEQSAAVTDVAQAAREIECVLPTGLDGESRDALAELQALEQELAAKKIEPEAARQSAAGALEDAARRLESQGDASVRERERVRDALSEAARQGSSPEGASKSARTPGADMAHDSTGSGQSGPKEASKEDSALVRALRSGDFAAAKQAADELLKSTRSGSPRAEAAQLDQLAKDLEAIQRKRDEADRSRREAERSAAEAGKAGTAEREGERVTSAPAESRDGSDPQSPPPSSDNLTSRRQADQAPGSPDARAKQEPAGERSSPGKLAEALRDAARELREQSQPREAEPSSTPPKQDASSPEQRQKKDQNGESAKKDAAQSVRDSTREPAADGQKESKPTENPESRTGEPSAESTRRTDGKGQQRSGQSGESAPARQEESGRERSSSEPRQTSGEGSRRNEREATGTQERAGERTPTSGQTPGEKGGDPDRTAESQGSETAQAEGTRQREGDSGQKSDGEQPPIPKPSPDAVKRLAEEVDRIARAPQDAGKKQRDADALRKKAQEMLERSSPEQRERLKQWGEAVAREREKREASNPGDAAQRQQEGPSADQPHAAQGAGERPKRSGSMPQGSAPQDSATSPGGDGAGTQPGTSNDRSEAKTLPQGRTEVVDARRPNSQPAPGAPESVAAEWLGQGSRTPAGDAVLARTLAQAAKSAERAIDDQTVPRRFDRVIERYFRRLPAAVKSNAESEAPPAAPAKDAP